MVPEMTRIRMRQDSKSKGQDGWIDLSGIANRAPWAGSANSPPDDLLQAAARFYGCTPDMVLPLANLQDMLPGLPDAPDSGALSRRDLTADSVMVANPALPNGRSLTPAQIRAMAETTPRLIVDESLADPRPDLSIIPSLPQNTLVLRNMAPFWGIRIWLAIAHPSTLSQIKGPVMPDPSKINTAAAALSDLEWADQMTIWLAEAALHLDQIMTAQGAVLVGGTHLFRLYAMKGAPTLQAHLARHKIRTAALPQNPRWLRLALPANRKEFARIRAAFV